MHTGTHCESPSSITLISQNAQRRCGNLILSPGFINEIKSVPCGPAREGSLLKIPFVFLCVLCVFVLKKVFLQSKKSSLPLRNRTPMRNVIANRLSQSSSFPRMLKGDVAISSLETETTFITLLAGTKQS
jgi:hypothetical protein